MARSAEIFGVFLSIFPNIVIKLKIIMVLYISPQLYVCVCGGPPRVDRSPHICQNFLAPWKNMEVFACRPPQKSGGGAYHV